MSNNLYENIDFNKEGRKLPSNLDMEKNVLSAILINGDAIEQAIEVFSDEREEVFYAKTHKIVYKAMFSLYRNRDPIDIETVASQLSKNDQLDEIGGSYEIAAMSTKLATSANIEYYARIVKEKYLYRKMISLCSDISTQAYEETKDVFDLIELTSKNVFDISQSSVRKKATKIAPLLKQTITKIQDLQNRKSSVTGISSGFSDLDRLTAGFQDADLVIVAARPSTGKTALALAFARNAAVESKMPVLFFSLEMAEHQLALRLLCAEARADAQKVRMGKVSTDEIQRIISRIDALAYSELYIDDTPSISIIELVAKSRRMKQEKDIGMVIVDYLQLISPVRDNKMNREQEIAQISRSLKALAKQLNIPVIALAQLNRAVEQRSGEKKPQLSDLRESGSIEQDADVVMFLSRPEAYGIKEYSDGTSTKDIIEVIIGKQRNGPTGEIKVKFLKQFGKFETLTTVYSEQDLPSPNEESKMSESAFAMENKHKTLHKKDSFDSDDAPF